MPAIKLIDWLKNVLRVTKKPSRLAQDRYLFNALRIEEKDLKNHPLLQQLIVAIEYRLLFHRENLQKTKKINSFLANCFSLLIPITSSLLTLSVGNTMIPIHYPNQWVGIFLTIITIINSVLRPAEKVIHSGHLLVILHDWEMDLIITLQKIMSGKKEGEEYINDTFDFLKKKDLLLSKIGAEIVDFESPTHINTKNDEVLTEGKTVDKPAHNV